MTPDMKLTEEELAYITQQMGVYKIRFQEIYFEILDHVITAVENVRFAGDTQPVETLFQQIIDTQFGDRNGIEKLSRTQARLYGLKIHKMVWKNYRTNLIWKTAACIAVTLLLEFMLPESRVITVCIYAAMFVVMASLMIYIIIRMREVKFIPKKQSLTKNYVLSEALIAVVLLNLSLTIPNFIDHVLHYRARFFIENHPGIPIYLLCFTTLYASSCYQVFKHELKLLKR